MLPAKKPTVIEQLTLWITPGLVSILGLFVWTSVNEIRSDVKELLGQSAEYRVKIASNEARITKLEQQVWEMNRVKAPLSVGIPAALQVVATKPEVPDFTVKKDPPKIASL
jgi:hypothetical protein